MMCEKSRLTENHSQQYLRQQYTQRFAIVWWIENGEENLKSSQEVFSKDPKVKSSIKQQHTIISEELTELIVNFDL